MSRTDHVHPTAALGYGHGADTYSRGRPEFPAAALDWLRNALELHPGKLAVELGAGTGKFTRTLVATGARVVAIEPVSAMLDRLKTSLPGIEAMRGEAQQIPLADATVDAVVCAQAFHWFANTEALAEIHRVLKPAGVLGLIWNVRDQAVGWLAELTKIMAPHEGDAPRYDSEEWRKVFPAPGFGALHETSFANSHLGPPEQVIVDRVASVSFIAALEAPERERVLHQVRALIAATPSIAGREAVAFPYVTRAYWCRRD